MIYIAQHLIYWRWCYASSSALWLFFALFFVCIPFGERLWRGNLIPSILANFLLTYRETDPKWPAEKCAGFDVSACVCAILLHLVNFRHFQFYDCDNCKLLHSIIHKIRIRQCARSLTKTATFKSFANASGLFSGDPFTSIPSRGNSSSSCAPHAWAMQHAFECIRLLFMMHGQTNRSRIYRLAHKLRIFQRFERERAHMCDELAMENGDSRPSGIYQPVFHKSRLRFRSPSLSLDGSRRRHCWLCVCIHMCARLCAA